MSKGSTRSGSSVSISLLWLFLCYALVCASLGSSKCMFFGFPEVNYDGVDRTEQLTEKTYNKTVDADGALSVVFFSDVEADDPELEQYECFLQLSAQVMEKRGYKFYTVNTTKEVKLRKQEDVDVGEDTIHVYKDGYQIEYHGIRDPSTFISWILDIPDEPVTIINSKEDKRDFDELDDEVTQVVGWFQPGSKALEEFEDAAEDFMGEVEFYAVVDKYWAKKVGLKEVGDVLMFRPYEDEPLEAPDTIDTEEEFEEWVEENKDPVLQKLSEYNYFDVWADPEEDEFLILAFADDEEPEGRALVQLLKKVANKFSDQAGELEIVLIDPGEFPLMIDVWETMFGIEIEEGPQIGLVDISEREGIWLDMSVLNLEDAKKYEEENEEVLERWIEQILNKTIALGHHRIKFQQFDSLRSMTLVNAGRTGLMGYPSEESFGRVLEQKQRGDERQLLLRQQQKIRELETRLRHLEALFKTSTNPSSVESQLSESAATVRGLGLSSTKATGNNSKFLLRSIAGASSTIANESLQNLQLSRRKSGRRAGRLTATRVDDDTPNLKQTAASVSAAAEKQRAGSYFHNGYNLLPPVNPRRQRQPKSLRRCRRKQTEKCNFLEKHLVLNPLIMYFVCAALVGFARAMRIHVSFYMCPVIDDWRDYLRQRLPPAVLRTIRI